MPPKTDIDDYVDELGTGNRGSVDTNSIKVPTYTIYIDDSGRVNAVNGISGPLYCSTASAPATSAETTSLFGSVIKAVQQAGGLVYLKAGTYTLNAERAIGSQTHPEAFITLRGESMNSVVIKHDPAARPFTMLRWWTHGSASDFTIDGQGLSGGQLYHGSPTRNWVQRVHFMNAGNNGVGCHTFQTLGIWIDSCWFDKTSLQDQVAIGSTEHAYVTNNFFDKRIAGIGGSIFGSSLTSGGIENYVVTGNVFVRQDTDIGADFITVEPRGGVYDRIVMSNNAMRGGTVLFGGTNWSTGGFRRTPFRNIIFSNNAMKYCRLWINGDPNNDPANGSIQQVNIQNNVMSNSQWSLIHLVHVSGPVIMSCNQLRDSNASNGTGGDRGLCYVEGCNNMNVHGNFFHQEDNSQANTSNYAFRIFGGCTNIMFHGNQIYNPILRSTFVLDTFGGPNSNVRVWDNEGYRTNNEGAASLTGNGSNTSFTINHNLDITPTVVTVNPSTTSGGIPRITNINSSSFDVTFTTPPSPGSFTVYWTASKRVFA